QSVDHLGIATTRGSEDPFLEPVDLLLDLAPGQFFPFIHWHCCRVHDVLSLLITALHSIHRGPSGHIPGITQGVGFLDHPNHLGLVHWLAPTPLSTPRRVPRWFPRS